MQMQLPVWIGDKLYNSLASKEIIEAYIAYFRHLQEMYLRTPTLFSVHSYRNNKHLLTSNREIIFFYFYPLSYLQKKKTKQQRNPGLARWNIRVCELQLHLYCSCSIIYLSVQELLKYATQPSFPSSYPYLSSSSNDPYPNSRHKYYHKFLLKRCQHFIKTSKIPPPEIIAGLKVSALKKTSFVSSICCLYRA